VDNCDGFKVLDSLANRTGTAGIWMFDALLRHTPHHDAEPDEPVRRWANVIMTSEHTLYHNRFSSAREGAHQGVVLMR